MPNIANTEMKDIVGHIFLVCILFGLSLFLPMIGFFIALFIPLPTLYYQAKLNRLYGMIATGLAALAIFIIAKKLNIDIIFFAELLFIGTLLNLFFQKKLPVEMVLGLTCLAVLVSTATGLIFYSVTHNQGIGLILSTFIGQNLELTLALYKDMGMPEENLNIFSAALGQLQHILVTITPAIITVATMLVVWVNILTAKPLFYAKGMPYPAFGRLNRWRAPEVLVWPVIGCGISLLLPLGGISKIGINGLIILLTIYFFQGIAIVSFFFDKKNFSRVARVLIYGLIVMMPQLLILVVGLGFFDTWINFRKFGNQTHE